MRTIVRNAVLVAGAVLLCAGGTARASTVTMLKVNVPFPFVVRGENFPAGTYTVERDDLSSSLVLLIRGEGNNHAATFVSTMRDGGYDPAGSAPALTFKRYENQERLTKVWESERQGWDLSSR